MDEREHRIQEILKNTIDLELSTLQACQFVRFYDLLVEKNKVMNLTRITDFEDAAVKHFADSLAIARHVQINGTERILDLGTGAGFPGIPLKILFPETEMTLIDSVGKKVKFVQEASDKLGLSNVTAVHGRAEDLARNPKLREQYDLVVSRAVANLSSLAEYCLPFVKIGGNFAAYKTADNGEEIKNAEKAIRILGGSKPVLLPYELCGMNRLIVRIKKIRTTPDLYPRKAGTPSKHPL